ncbi:TPA: restriction endonuclease subunit S [Klebsiella pneumoniae]
MNCRKPPIEWSTVNLGSLINLSTGKLDANAADINGQYPFFTCAESISQINTWAFDTSAVILAGNGSFSIKRYTGKFNAYQRTYIIEPVFIKIDFLYWVIRGNIISITMNGRGSTIPYIRKGDITDIQISLPPLAEQKIIADKLDDLLARVESIKTRLENIPEILKKFRQSVLSAAVSGKLTEEWRNKYSDSEEVFTELDGMNCFRDVALPKLPKKWKWLRFDQVAEIASNLKSPLDYPDAIHIAPNHVESWTGKLSDFQTISQDNVTSAKHEFYPGQIIYSKIRPYLCKVAIAKFGGLCSADMYPINSKIETDFLFRWMLTITFTDWASNAESRSVLPKINQKDLSKVPVPTPPISEQQEIVRLVQTYLSYADSIQSLVCNGLLRITSLTQSILAKAFRGELTAQWREENPELISGLNSAEALLEKITAEKLAAGTVNKRAKKPSH